MRAGEVLNQIWTIARHSLTQAIRMKIVLVLGVFLIVLVPALPFLLKSDNTQEGQIRLIMTYSLYLTSFIMSVLTLFLACATLNLEVKGKHILLLDPKPVHRFTLLVGKWLGVMLIAMILLAAMLGTTYGLVRWFGRPPKVVDMKKLDAELVKAGAQRANVQKLVKMQRALFTGDFEESDTKAFDAAVVSCVGDLKGKRVNPLVVQSFRNAVERSMTAARDYQNVKAQLLSARVSQRPPLPNLMKWVDETVQEMKQKRMMPKKRTETWVRERLAVRFSRAAWSVPPNAMHRWKLSGIPQFHGWLVIRFKFLRSKGSHDHELPCRFVINETTDKKLTVQRTYRVGKLHTFAVPSKMVGKNGTLEISFYNMDRSGVGALFPFQDGIQVLYPAASLAENFVRAGLVLLLRISLIAIVGIFASTFLSQPVAVLLAMFVFLVGHMQNKVVMTMLPDLHVFGSGMVPPGTPPHGADVFLRQVVGFFFSLFPNFGSFNAVLPLSEGFLVGWGVVVACFVRFILVYGSVMTVAGWYIFRRRELALHMQ